MFAKERRYKREHKRLPPLTMLIELAEDDIAALNNKIANVQSALGQQGLNYHVISDSDEYAKFWAIRRKSYKLLKDNTPGITAAVFIEDFCVNPTELPSFFPAMLQLLQRNDIKATVAGHAGNGNFHIIPLMDLSDPNVRSKIIPVMQEIHQLIWDHGGTISGEHNDGILRTPFVEQQFGTDMYDLFKQVKSIFDPNNIFNPGKKIGGTIKDLEVAMITENPEQKTKKIYA
jgi:FAD/FMN-containing dehydrogenase